VIQTIAFTNKKGAAKEISSTPLRITKTIERLKDVRIDFQCGIQTLLIRMEQY